MFFLNCLVALLGAVGFLLNTSVMAYCYAHNSDDCAAIFKGMGSVGFMMLLCSSMFGWQMTFLVTLVIGVVAFPLMIGYSDDTARLTRTRTPKD